jgi:hypothetical protein
MRYKKLASLLVPAVMLASFDSIAAYNSPAYVSAADGIIFTDSFEGGTNNWTGRGAASVKVSGDEAYEGTSSLFVSGRTSAWNGASKELSADFVPGTEYSFSANVKFTSGGASDKFYMKLQYKDASGTVNYSGIAEAETMKGEWVQLANTNYLIPADATDIQIYVETANSTNNFYLDDVSAAEAGTVIKGSGGPKKLIYGDLNYDQKINAFDVAMERELIAKDIVDKSAEKAADVDHDGNIGASDLVLLEEYVMGITDHYPDPPKPDNKWDDYQETASAQELGFWKDSICSMGNTYRLTSKLEAAEQGAPLTLAYLGGSITEGKKYSSPFSAYIKDTFAAGSFTEVNAGMSGTSSVVGLVRSEKDIVSKNPDIIVMEFSVNDHEDILYKKSFESCVKKFLELPNEPAVIVLINRSKGGFSSQAQMEKIGRNMDVPIISMDNALTKAFNSGYLSPSDYYTDEYHPHDAGGKLISNCMAYFVRQAMRTENRSDSYTIPTTAAFGTEYETCVNTSPQDLENFNAGSFTAGQGYGSLPYGYTFQKFSNNTPMTFKTTGKGLIIVFKADSKDGMGNILVTVNGKTTTIKGKKLYTWGGPDAELGYYQDVAGDLDVSIKMENASSDFTIWGLGIIK